MHATTKIAARSIGHSRFSKSGVSCIIWTGGSSETLQTPLFTLILATASLVQLPQTPSQSFGPCGS
ncbi:hypothetical protein CGCVW01_v005055 [Colletotrichum viniferum]|nr:hypothetical protein CGCVW01_v005055 [Colletotrichum viniferum]